MRTVRSYAALRAACRVVQLANHAGASSALVLVTCRSADATRGTADSLNDVVTHFIEDYGLWFLFGIVCLESAGLWLPGETALIAAAVYAAKGQLSIVAIIAVAAVAAIIGDNIGYWIGREGGRRLIYRWTWLQR